MGRVKEALLNGREMQDDEDLNPSCRDCNSKDVKEPGTRCPVCHAEWEEYIREKYADEVAMQRHGIDPNAEAEEINDEDLEAAGELWDKLQSEEMTPLNGDTPPEEGEDA